jgi:hypothetical protein
MDKSDKYYYINEYSLYFRFDDNDSDLIELEKIIRDLEEKYKDEPSHIINIFFQLKEKNNDILNSLHNIQYDNRYIELFDKSTSLIIQTMFSQNNYEYKE